MDATERLAIAFDLYDTAVQMMRQTLARRYPTETPREREARLEAWLLTRPPDAVGVEGRWPRS